jgi:chemotaxis methyl-accepting protein methylase
MIFRRCLEAYLAKSSWIWRHLPASWRLRTPGLAYGRHLHSLVCRYARRSQSHGTYFLRNRPESQLICRLLDRKAQGASLDISVLACSKGAEVYSMMWAIRTARPDLRVSMRAIDISQEILDFAEEGVYSLKTFDCLKPFDRERMTEAEKLAWSTCRDQPPQNMSIFQRMNEREMEAMFDREGNRAEVKLWLKAGITWRVGDATSPQLIDELGPQDMVVANRFLCHMDPATAEACLRNIAGLVKPGGYIFVSGVDLDVRAKVAREKGWKPVLDLIREVHDGDVSLRSGWPLEWWGLEPLSESRADWKLRYASAFQIGEAPSLQGDAAPAQMLESSR